MGVATIKGKVRKVKCDKNGCRLCIEVDKNGIEKNIDKYYKLLSLKNDDGKVKFAYAQAVEKDEDEDYYCIEICVSTESCKLIEPASIPLLIGKKIKIKFKYQNLPTPPINETILCETQDQPTTQAQKTAKIEIVECEIYE